ncbi:MAG: TIM barrel protein [Lentisphaeria bacterium]|nr:TIM barrel protein [Lentisphaeria bacterium]
MATLKGRIRQAASRWCYNKVPAAEFYAACREMGLVGIDLVGPAEWPLLKEHGLICTCTPSHSLTKGLNRREHHEVCLNQIRASIEANAEAGFPNVVCFSGNREGISDEEGAANCVVGLKQVAGLAERRKVTLVIELLNSKVNHKDYQADRTAWTVDICKRVGSPRVKVLYDIYHMQIMEGDLIRTIRENIDWIGHFHTGGNPGRNEIDQTQEICYPPVMRAIAESTYDGYVGHEFVPTRDALTSLREAVALCDV